MILVAGAGGRLGGAVTAALLERGHDVRAGYRARSGARAPDGARAEAATLDLRRPATFAAALEGVDTIFTAVHAMTARAADSIARVDIEGHKRLIDAAAAAGVRRFVYTSALGAASDHPAPLLRAKAEVERHLAGSGLDHVILRPGAFMELYAHELIGAAVLAGKPVRLLGTGAVRRNLVSVADVAAIAVAALETESFSGRIIAIGGPDNLTDRDIADLYARLSGKPARISAIPPAIVRLLAAVLAPFHAGASHILRFSAALEGRDDLDFDASGMAALLGRQPVSLADFARARLGSGRARVRAAG